MKASLDRDQWIAVLETIADELGRVGPSIRLCLIKYQPDLAAVRKVVDTFENPGRRQALENLVFLEITGNDDMATDR